MAFGRFETTAGDMSTTHRARGHAPRGVKEEAWRERNRSMVDADETAIVIADETAIVDADGATVRTVAAARPPAVRASSACRPWLCVSSDQRASHRQHRQTARGHTEHGGWDGWRRYGRARR